MKHYCSKRDPLIKRSLVFTKKISTLVTKGRALLQIEKKGRASLGPQALEFRTPFFLIWSLPRLWYGSLSGSISLNHLSIFYNISCYNSLVLLTFVSRSSCRITYIYHSLAQVLGDRMPPFFVKKISPFFSFFLVFL